MVKTVENNETVTQVAISTSHQAFARNNGAKLSDALADEVNNLIIKKEDVKLGPFTLRIKLQEAGFDFSIFPEIGSEEGNNPHYYEAQGKGNRTVQGNYFKDYFLGTVHGQEYLTKLEDAELAANAETKSQSKMYGDKDKLYVEDEIAMLKSRITAGGNLFQTAAHIYQQEQVFASSLDKAKVTFDFNGYEDAKGDWHMKRSNNPFVVGKPGTFDFERLNVQQFLKLNIPEAVANGGTYGAVIATLERGTKSRSEKFKIVTLDDIFAMLGNIASYLDTGTEEGEKRMELIKKKMHREDQEEKLLAWGDANLVLDGPWAEFKTAYAKASAKVREATRDLNKSKAA